MFNSLLSSFLVLIFRLDSLFQYDAERLLALTHAGAWGAGARAATLRTALRMLATVAPTPGTGHFGEHYFRATPGTGSSVEQLNDMPHCWEHSLVYLTAMRLYPPAVNR